MKTYDFNYTDVEGDTFQSNDHASMAEVQAEVSRLSKRVPGFQIVETWIYENDEFVGRFNF